MSAPPTDLLERESLLMCGSKGVLTSAATADAIHECINIFHITYIHYLKISLRVGRFNIVNLTTVFNYTMAGTCQFKLLPVCSTVERGAVGEQVLFTCELER